MVMVDINHDFVDGDIGDGFIEAFSVILSYIVKISGLSGTTIIGWLSGFLMRRSRRQRIAISQAEIGRRCKLLGPICQGFRAFREGIARENNPCQGKDQKAWFSGWDLAEDKYNDSTHRLPNRSKA